MYQCLINHHQSLNKVSSQLKNKFHSVRSRNKVRMSTTPLTTKTLNLLSKKLLCQVHLVIIPRQAKLSKFHQKRKCLSLRRRTTLLSQIHKALQKCAQFKTKELLSLFTKQLCSRQQFSIYSLKSNKWRLSSQMKTTREVWASRRTTTLTSNHCSSLMHKTVLTTRDSSLRRIHSIRDDQKMLILKQTTTLNSKGKTFRRHTQ